MPWERIVQLCKEHDALSLVDAAHHLGQLPVDLGHVRPDFWVSVSVCSLLWCRVPHMLEAHRMMFLTLMQNCHKWLMR